MGGFLSISGNRNITGFLEDLLKQQIRLSDKNSKELNAPQWSSSCQLLYGGRSQNQQESAGLQ